MIYEGHLDGKKLKSGSILAGKPFSLDFELDTLHVRLRAGNTAYSDYVEMPESRYIIVDFDKADNVLGYSVEGFLFDFRKKSLKGRIILALHLQRLSAVDLARSVAEFIGKQLPDIDSSGKLRHTPQLVLA